MGTVLSSRGWKRLLFKLEKIIPFADLKVKRGEGGSLGNTTTAIFDEIGELES